MKHLGLYIFHGIASSHQVKKKPQLTKVNESNRNDFINEVFGRRDSGSHKYSKDFFATVYPVLQTPPRATKPNWSIEILFQHAIRIYKQYYLIVVNISID